MAGDAKLAKDQRVERLIYYWRNLPIDICGPTEIDCEIYKILYMKAFL